MPSEFGLEPFDVFDAHFVESDGVVNASMLISKACIKAFFGPKFSGSTKQCEQFKKSLLNHVQGINRAQHFSRKQEKALLAILRQNKQWPCFDQTIDCSLGASVLGYYERKKLKKIRVENEEEDEVEEAPKATTPPPSAVIIPPPTQTKQAVVVEEEATRLEHKRMKLVPPQAEPGFVPLVSSQSNRVLYMVNPKTGESYFVTRESSNAV